MTKITLMLIVGLLSASCLAAGSVEEIVVQGQQQAAAAAAAEMGRRYGEAMALEQNRLRGYESMLKAQADQARAKAERENQAAQRVESCKNAALYTRLSCITQAENAKSSNMNTCHGLYIGGALSAIAGGLAAIPTFGFAAAAGAAGAVTLTTAGLICSDNAQGAYEQKINYCQHTFDSGVSYCK